MNTPEFMIEIFLQPGEFYWSNEDTRIRTILGSCVAICTWHPIKKIGGMTHSLLPLRETPHLGEISGRYIDESIDLILLEIFKSNTRIKDYEVKIFGGGDMLGKLNKDDSMKIGARNVKKAKELMLNLGFNVTKEHVGGEGHRNIFFDLWSGDVWLQHKELSRNK